MKTESGMPTPLDDIRAHAQKMMSALNLLALFASPKVVAKTLAGGGKLPPPDVVIDHLEVLIDTAPGSTFGGQGTPRRPAASVIPTVRAVQRLFERWKPSEGVPLELQEGARQLLDALGIDAPPGGWDSVEGPPPREPREPEDPDPRPPPTEAELAARPDIIHHHAAIMWCRYLASPKMVAKVPPAALRRPALGHIDNLLANFRPLRSNHATARAAWIAIVQRLEALRALCEAWDDASAPAANLQEAVRQLLMVLDRKSDADEYEAFEEEVEPFYLEPLPSQGS